LKTEEGKREVADGLRVCRQREEGGRDI